jgi:molecular chaperone GrpE
MADQQQQPHKDQPRRDDGGRHDDVAVAEAEAHDVDPGPLPEDAPADDAEALRAEVQELKDRLLRALAEAENIRKRADRDRRDAETYGITRFARDILSVHDNFERALKAATDEARAVAGPLIEGVELTQKELLNAFARNGIKPVTPAKGDRFDPRLHQAMFEASAPGTSAGEIIEVMGGGFTIGERLLRPAQVGVSAGAPPKPATEQGADDGDGDGAARS